MTTMARSWPTPSASPTCGAGLCRDLDHHAVDPARQRGGERPSGTTYDLIRKPRRAPSSWCGSSPTPASSATGWRAPVVSACSGDKLDQVAAPPPVPEPRRGIICGTHVTVDAGTGLVHGPRPRRRRLQHRQKYGLPVNNPVGNDGKFLGNTPPLVGGLAGLSVWQANPGAAGTGSPGAVPQGREDPAQLPPLLAPQDADHLPRHHPVVHRHGSPQIQGRTPTLRWIAERAVDETSSSRPGAAPAWRR